MKYKEYLAIFLLLFGILKLSAQNKEKGVTLNISNVTLSEAMTKFEKASGYTFFSDASQVNTRQKVSLKVKDTPVRKAVDLLLRNTNLTYEITNTQIALFQKKAESHNKYTHLKGKVLDQSGEPVIGASVWIEGTTVGTVTNLDGEYELDATTGSPLKISYIGYQTQVVKASQGMTVKL